MLAIFVQLVLFVSATPAQAISYSTQNQFEAGFERTKYSNLQPDSLWVVVNKQRGLNPTNYKPKNLKRPNFANPRTSNPSGQMLRQDAGSALVAMDKAMFKALGEHIVLRSAYRSYQTQVRVVAQSIATKGSKAKGEKYAARPGFSEHQTGLAADLSATSTGCAIIECFAETKPGKWLAANSYKFGFVLRYDYKQTAVTGYAFEPWHFRFVGTELSNKYHEAKAKSLEEYFLIPKAPEYFN